MDLATLIAYIAGAAVALGIASIVLVKAMASGGGEVTGGYGYTSFERARKVRADAYLLAIDVDANTMYWVPLKDAGTYYLFLTKKTGRFLPIDRRPLNVVGKPVYVGVRVGDAAVEVSVPVALVTNLAKLQGDKELFTAQSFLSAIRKLYQKVLESPSSSETAESPFFIDIDYRALYMLYATLTARAFSRIMDSAKSHIMMSFEKGEDIEKRLVTQATILGKFLIYAAIAAFVAILAVIIWNVLR